MSVVGATNVIVRNCVFVANEAVLSGGAMRIENASAAVSNCSFITNDGGASGGAVSCVSGCSASFTDCLFEDNVSALYGGAIRCLNGSVGLANCRFQHNRADYGGAIRTANNGNATVRNCVFFDNNAKLGGAVECAQNSAPTFTNCTLANNIAEGGLAFSAIGTAHPTVVNCILWNIDDPSQIYIKDAGSVTVEYSDVFKGYAGPGNIGGAPNFVDYYGGDLHIKDGESPCVDSADGNRAPPFDMEGYPRVDYKGDGGAGVGPPWADMGAHEFQPNPLEIAIGNVSLSEGHSGTKTFSFQVSLSIAMGVDVSVDYATANGTAQSGSDYTSTSGTLVIPAGETSGYIDVSVEGDTKYEPNQTFYVNISNASIGGISDSQGLGTIQNDDPLPVVSFAADQNVAESVGSATVTATLDRLSELNVTVPFTVGGTATGGGVDHNAADGSILISAGNSSAGYTFNVTNDLLDENDETVAFAMGTPTNATAGVSTHTATVQDNDAMPTVDFAGDQNVDEAAGTVTVTATLSAESGLDVTVPFTVGGTAASPADHNAANDSIVIAAGDLSNDHQFNVVDDALDEDNETVTFNMGTPVNATAGVSTHTVTITDNDAPPTVDFAGDQNVDEAAGTVTVTATLSAESGLDVTVPFTVSGTAGNPDDHAATNGSIVITAGQTSGTYQFAVVEDTLDEDDETVVLTMGTPTNADQGTTTTHTVTILDNDATPTVDFALDQSVDEMVGAVTVTATLSAVSGRTVAVPFTVGGTASGGGVDHDAADASITVVAGSPAGSYTFNVTDDALDENDETVTFAMGAPVNAGQGTTTTHTVTIQDNDAAPTVDFAVDQSVNEDAATVTVTATLSAVSGLDVTVPFTVSGTATGGGTDHDASGGSIAISAGSPDGTYQFVLTDDALDENDETVIFTMGAPTNAVAGASTHTVTISDNDAPPTVGFSLDQNVAEMVGTVTVTAALDVVSGLQVTVPFSVVGTATNPDDHNAADGNLTIPAGTISVDYQFDVVDDALDESDETVILAMGAPTNATKGNGTHTATITDDDAPPTVEWTTASQSAAESIGTVAVTAQLSVESGLDVTVPFTLGGDATGGGVDYDDPASPITIAAGETTAGLTITIIDDAEVELSQTIVLTMSSPTNATLGATVDHTVTISDNDGTGPTINWTAAAQPVGEDAGVVTVTAILGDEMATTDITVEYTVGGTASAADHDAVAGTVSFASSDPAGTTKDVTFNVTDDILDEDDETVVLSLTSVTLGIAKLGTTVVHTVTITDDDPSPAADFAVDQNVDEDAGTVTVTVTLDAASGRDVTVPFTVGGTAGSPSDHNASDDSIVIAAGDLSGTYSFNVTDDVLDEDDETVVLTMGAPTNATQGTTTAHTVTIADNDSPPTVDLAASQSVGEAVGTATVTATLDAASGLEVTVPFTVSGTAANPDDHDAANGSITIAAGELTGTCLFDVVDDALDEDDETIIFTMTTGSVTNAQAGDTTSHTVTITDDDVAPAVDFAVGQDVLEDVGTVIVTATLDAASGLDVTVPFTVGGTATGGGTDHSALSGDVVISHGSTNGSCTFDVVDDLLDEEDETVVFTMGTPTNATQGTTTLHTVTIMDDDAPPTVEWTAASQFASESVGTVTATAQLSAASGHDVTVPFALSGTATGGGVDYNDPVSPITITAGELSNSVSITVIDDLDDESAGPNETIVLTMGAPTNATQGAMGVHTVEIIDNDAADVPTVEWSVASQSVGEGVGTVTITATLDMPAPETIDVACTVGGSAANPADHDAADGTVSFAVDDTSAVVSIAIADDLTDENNETIVLTMTEVTSGSANFGTTVVHTVTITDNDPAPTVVFAADQNVDEGVGSATLTATLDVASGLDVTVPFTVSGTATNPDDHNAVMGSITISAGGLSGSYAFSIQDDELVEGNETILFLMGAPTNAIAGLPSVHVVTITDNDTKPTVQCITDSQAVSEGDGTVTATAALSRAAPESIVVVYTVAGTAANPEDHNAANGTVSFDVGESTDDVVIILNDDSLEEGVETITLTLAFVTTGDAEFAPPNVQTVTIVDNDGAGSLTVVATSPSDGATDVALSTAVRVTFSESMNQAVTEGAFALEGDAGTVAGTFSWGAAGAELTFTPGAELKEGTTYTATIGAAATSESGVPLGEDYVFAFTTAEQWGGVFRHGCGSPSPAGAVATLLLLCGLAVAALRRRSSSLQ